MTDTTGAVEGLNRTYLRRAIELVGGHLSEVAPGFYAEAVASEYDRLAAESPTAPRAHYTLRLLGNLVEAQALEDQSILDAAWEAARAYLAEASHE